MRPSFAKLIGVVALVCLPVACCTTGTKPASCPTDVPAARLMKEYDHAKALSQAGKYEEALRAYLFVYDNSRNTGLDGVRGSFLLGQLVDMGRKYPPAIAALKARRDRAERMLVRGTGGCDELDDLACLNDVLGEANRTIAVYDKLKSSAAGRTLTSSLPPRLCDTLLSAGRYDDFVASKSKCILRLADDLAKIELGSDFPRAVYGRPTPLPSLITKKMKQRAMRGYAALLATGRTETASKLKKWILRPRPDAATYVGLVRAAITAKKPDAARALVDEARGQLPPDDMKQVDDAVKSSLAP